MAFWMIPLALAAAGALADKEKPLRGAMVGAGIGLTGGAAAGALGAGAAGAGAGSALVPGAIGSTTGVAASFGVPGVTTAAGGLAASATPAVAPGLLGSIGTQAAAPVTNLSTKAGLFDTLNVKSGGLLGRAQQYGKPLANVANIAQQAQQQAAESEPPPAQTTPLPDRPLNLGELLQGNVNQQQQEEQDNERRRQMMAQYVNRIGGRQ